MWMLMPGTSLAKFYECEKQHSQSWWPDASHIPESSQTSVMSFNDKNGGFWLNVGTPRAGSKLQIKERFNSNGRGKIVAARENDWGDEVLIIRRPKKDKFHFVFMTEDGAITGTCHIVTAHQGQK
jgi:hypothetical protein